MSNSYPPQYQGNSQQYQRQYQQQQPYQQQYQQQQYQQPYQQPVMPVMMERRSNGMGTAGFVLALIAFFFGWIPVLGWIIWLLGLIFSIVGVCRQPRGLAIAGLVISGIWIIALIIVVATMGVSIASLAAMGL